MKEKIEQNAEIVAQKETFRKIKKDKFFREEFIIKNLPLAASIVHERYEVNPPEVDKEDALSEAKAALVKAVDSFNPDSGAKFSTYAYATVTNELNAFFAGESDKGFGVLDKKLYYRVLTIQENLSKELETQPSYVEIAMASNGLLTPAKVQELCTIGATGFISLDLPVGENNETEKLHERVADTSNEERSRQAAASEAVEVILAKADKELSDMVRMQFGINPYDRKYSLDEIGSKYNVTGECVRVKIKKFIAQAKQCQ